MASTGGTEISRRINSIENEIKKLSNTCKSTTQIAKNLGEALKYDPSNTKLQSQYMDSLQKSIQTTTEKMNLLVQEQQRLESEGITDANRKRFEQIGVQISDCQKQLAKFNSDLKQSNDLTKQVNESQKNTFSGLKSSFDQAASSIKSIAKTLAGVVASVMAIGVAFASTADKIDVAINKFGGTAEEWQTNSFIWDRLTGSADAYEQILSAINSNLGQVQKESSRVGTVLEQLGLTFDDLKGKTSTEALQIYLDALSNIGDEAERQAIAVSLFGESVGVYLAQMLSTSTDQINEWTQAAQEAGIMTNEQVAEGAKLQDTLDDLTKTFKTMIATLGTALMPLIQTIANIVKSLSPMINGIASALNALGPVGTTIIVMIGAIIAAVVKLVYALAAMHVASGNIAQIAFAVAAIGLLATAGIATGVAMNLGNTNSSSYSSNGSFISQSVDDLASNATEISNSNNDSGNTENTQNITYNDYSTVNQDISSDVDYDEFARYMSNKKRQIIGG